MCLIFQATFRADDIDSLVNHVKEQVDHLYAVLYPRTLATIVLGIRHYLTR